MQRRSFRRSQPRVHYNAESMFAAALKSPSNSNLDSFKPRWHRKTMLRKRLTFVRCARDKTREELGRGWARDAPDGRAGMGESKGGGHVLEGVSSLFFFYDRLLFLQKSLINSPTATSHSGVVQAST